MMLFALFYTLIFEVITVIKSFSKLLTSRKKIELRIMNEAHETRERERERERERLVARD